MAAAQSQIITSAYTHTRAATCRARRKWLELRECVPPPKQSDTQPETDKESATHAIQEEDAKNNEVVKRSHLTLAHGLFLLGFYFLVQGFPGEQRLQDWTIWDAALFL